MNKYEELMDKVEVTPEMRERVLYGIGENLARNQEKTVDIVDITQATGVNRGKRTGLYRKLLPLAACFALLLLAGIAVPRLLHPIPDYTGDETQVIPDITEWASAEELSEKVGFPVEDISTLKEQSEETIYLAQWDMAEIQYLVDGQTISYRKSQPAGEDNSGVYETYESERTETVNGQEYTLKGNGDTCSLILWEDEDYSYSIYFEEAVSVEQAEAIVIEEVG